MFSLIGSFLVLLAFRSALKCQVSAQIIQNPVNTVLQHANDINSIFACNNLVERCVNFIEVSPGSKVYTHYHDPATGWQTVQIDLANPSQEFDRCFDLTPSRTVCVNEELKEIKRMARTIGLLNQPIDYNLGNSRYNTATPTISESYYNPIQRQLWIRTSDLNFYACFSDGTNFSELDPADTSSNHLMTRIIRILKLWESAPTDYTNNYLRVFETGSSFPSMREYAFQVTEASTNFGLVPSIAETTLTNGAKLITDIALQTMPFFVALTPDTLWSTSIIQLYEVKFLAVGGPGNFELKFESN